MKEKKKETCQELCLRIANHLESHPNSRNKSPLLRMHSFFYSQPDMEYPDNLYARCASTVVNERIAEDIKAEVLNNQPRK